MTAIHNVNPDEYRVMEIDPQWRADDESKLGIELMGSKKKFWFRHPSDKQAWLFKTPTVGTGQHWAEKIAFEIARKMHIDAPQVELASYRKDKSDDVVLGSATLSFIESPGGDAEQIKRELVHGNQILRRTDKAYIPKDGFRQSMHTVQRIFGSMIIFKSNEHANESRATLAEYLLLDAVICNTDRHHENWGILRRKVDGGWRGILAPTFDHASSLGHGLQDSGREKSRQGYLQELGIECYVARGHGAVFIDGTAKRAPSPLGVVEWCLQNRDLKQYFHQALGKLADIDDGVAVEIVHKIPHNVMSTVAKEFVCELVAYNLSKLKSFTL